MRSSYIYILANTYRTSFYIGVTSDLSERIVEHADGKASEFTKKYNIKDLIYYEEFSDINQAIAREKQLKNWHKTWKLNLNLFKLSQRSILDTIFLRKITRIDDFRVDSCQVE